MSVAAAIIDELSERELAELAQRLEPYIAPPQDQWLDAKQASEHLAISIETLHRHTSNRAIPFHQDCPGGKLYFKRSELDRWRESG